MPRRLQTGPRPRPTGEASQREPTVSLHNAAGSDGARTDPQQKLDIVEAWRDRGDVTAMTGDGVNDGPALRQADIGVAMGRRGTEVARQSADLVLTDDKLSTVVAAVEEGRRVYDNIRRFLVYGLAGGTAEILVMLVGPLLGLSLPLRAGQILWINLLTHGLTGVAMGAEPVSPRAMHRPPRPPHQHVLGHGLWQRVLFLAAVVTMASLAAALSARAVDAAWQSVLFLSLLAAQLGVVMGPRDRLLTRENLFLPAAVLASAGLAAAALYVPFLRSVLMYRSCVLYLRPSRSAGRKSRWPPLWVWRICCRPPSSHGCVELTERAPDEDVEKRLVAVHHAIRIREKRMGPFRLVVPGPRSSNW
ncbi:cation-translocating P-type ATPase [Streptomyces lunaelactis]|uniref:cation-translocating P-type ATPase n=1 Tax=Streptomyces lunaelactis TaxID=1535768 RepID=UPI00281687A9|nr:cation-translocating P-type ATPase [Streptomyces lunaelactis]